MTHKQQAIELLNEMAARAARLTHYRAMLANDVQRMGFDAVVTGLQDVVVDLRTHVTLMEPVENPAAVDESGLDCIGWDRPKGMDFKIFAATNALAQAKSLHDAITSGAIIDDEHRDLLPRVPMPRGPISLDAEEEPVLECSRCVDEQTDYRTGFPMKVVPVRAHDVNGVPACPQCGDRQNLRVRR